MKWVNKPSKEVLATSARMHKKIREQYSRFIRKDIFND